MFLNFVNFATCFFIVTCTFRKAIPATISSNEVQKEMDVFSKFLNMIPDDQLKGEFWGQLRMLARRAIKADQLIFEKGGLHKEKETLTRFKTLAKVCTRVEEFEKKCFPEDQVNPKSRYTRWKIILNAKNFHAREIRCRVEKEYAFTNSSDSHHMFATTLQKICGDLNLAENSLDNAGDDGVLDTHTANSKNAKMSFGLLGVNHEEQNLKALKIISEPLKLSSHEVEDVKHPEGYIAADRMRYAIIRPTFGELKTNTTQADISKFFGGILIKSVNIVPAQIIVEFENNSAAVKALNSCPVSLNGALVQVELHAYPHKRKLINSSWLFSPKR